VLTPWHLQEGAGRPEWESANGAAAATVEPLAEGVAGAG
jgi:hypothetical protein